MTDRSKISIFDLCVVPLNQFRILVKDTVNNKMIYYNSWQKTFKLVSKDEVLLETEDIGKIVEEYNNI